ncbi:unnamed protein product [Ceratitis capitata]|uniref:(Mediterranean fruit fly) hypothetical protein n=1 Tax=Ceratitis capitata TaxID=7213 RepID=A0A811UB11_CERCA|nr:unnamed protein product [Ceratitis capitata]
MYKCMNVSPFAHSTLHKFMACPAEEQQQQCACNKSQCSRQQFRLPTPVPLPMPLAVGNDCGCDCGCQLHTFIERQAKLAQPAARATHRTMLRCHSRWLLAGDCWLLTEEYP